MNLDILKIASDTNNNKSIKDYTHHSKLKNSRKVKITGYGKWEDYKFNEI